MALVEVPELLNEPTVRVCELTSKVPWVRVKVPVVVNAAGNCNVPKPDTVMFMAVVDEPIVIVLVVPVAGAMVIVTVVADVRLETPVKLPSKAHVPVIVVPV
jgi:hypothetical protein